MIRYILISSILTNHLQQLTLQCVCEYCYFSMSCEWNNLPQQNQEVVPNIYQHGGRDTIQIKLRSLLSVSAKFDAC